MNAVTIKSVIFVDLRQDSQSVSGKAIANLEYESVKHLGPVFINDTLRATTTVLEKCTSRSKIDRGIVYVETKAYNQHGNSVLSFRRKVLVSKRA